MHAAFNSHVVGYWQAYVKRVGDTFKLR